MHPYQTSQKIYLVGAQHQERLRFIENLQGPPPRISPRRARSIAQFDSIPRTLTMDNFQKVTFVDTPGTELSPGQACKAVIIIDRAVDLWQSASQTENICKGVAKHFREKSDDEQQHCKIFITSFHEQREEVFKKIIQIFESEGIGEDVLNIKKQWLFPNPNRELIKMELLQIYDPEGIEMQEKNRAGSQAHESSEPTARSESKKQENHENTLPEKHFCPCAII